MIVEVLTTNAGATMSVGIVAPGYYTRVWEVLEEKVAEPVDPVARRPCLLTVSIETMNRDNAEDALAM